MKDEEVHRGEEVVADGRVGCQGERVRECCEVSGMLGKGVWRDRQEAPGHEIQVRAEEPGSTRHTWLPLSPHEEKAAHSEINGLWRLRGADL